MSVIYSMKKKEKFKTHLNVFFFLAINWNITLETLKARGYSSQWGIREKKSHSCVYCLHIYVCM